MKNSLKLLLALLLATMFSAVHAGARGKDSIANLPQRGESVHVESQDNTEATKNNGRTRYDRFQGSKGVLNINKHILSYVPRDIRSANGIRGNEIERNNGYYRCDKNGNLVLTGGGICYTYSSGAQKTLWVVRYVTQPHGPVRAETIFKVRQNEFEIWATFDPKNDVNTYASTEARKFAGKQGDDNTNVANGNKSSPAGDINKDAQNGDTGELIKKGIGIMKELKF